MDAQGISSAVARFSAKFCNELDKSKNVVSSPLSAEILLALLTLGSTDPAHKELLTSLDFLDDDSIRSSFSAITSSLKSIKSITLDIANKVYLKEGSYELNPELQEDAVKVFDTSFEKLNFNDGPGSADTINKWVESKTNDRIKDLLPPGSIDSSTRIVLISALYFKGMWKNQFKPIKTKKMPFNIDTHSTVDVPMMNQEDEFIYGDSPFLQAKILAMDYKDEQAKMIIVLPDEIEGLNAVLQKLTDGYDLMAELEEMPSRDVKVTIPKFKIETEIDLIEVLSELGINAIFDKENSGLTKILDNDEGLYVSKAVQKTFIEVNEEGSEAATSTGMAVAVHKSLSITPVPSFHANRPFLYMLAGADHTTFLMGVFRGTD